jgi:hypothetical protein
VQAIQEVSCCLNQKLGVQRFIMMLGEVAGTIHVFNSVSDILFIVGVFFLL